MSPDPSPLLQTPLHAWHVSLGAKMVPFAGYAMPVQYPTGILAEHAACRGSAALFDVSHMGQVRLVSPDAAAALETLVPMDIVSLGLFKQRYAFFTNDTGGLLDDLMVTRREDDLFLVVNAGCKVADIEHLQKHLGHRCTVVPEPGLALLALQGPQAVHALAALDAAVSQLVFMSGGWFTLAGARCFVTRSGYTGEDGFEISVPADAAEALARDLLAQPGVQPAGLGARDTLRLEAGLCLYGHDIHTETTPVEAGLTWAIQKVRRPGGDRAGGYPGADRIGEQLLQGPPRRRVGLISAERTPVREGAELFSAEGTCVGRVTSGTVSPNLKQPIAMAYVDASQATLGTELQADVRGKRIPMRVCSMPFQPHRYHRG